MIDLSVYHGISSLSPWKLLLLGVSHGVPFLKKTIKTGSTIVAWTHQTPPGDRTKVALGHSSNCAEQERMAVDGTEAKPDSSQRTWTLKITNVWWKIIWHKPLFGRVELLNSQRVRVSKVLAFCSVFVSRRLLPQLEGWQGYPDHPLWNLNDVLIKVILVIIPVTKHTCNNVHQKVILN